MANEEVKRKLEMEALILPAIQMILTENERIKHTTTHMARSRKKPGHPNQKTVMKIIEALKNTE